MVHHSKDRRHEYCAYLRNKYLSVLNEPVPPRLKALVEKLRDVEEAKKSKDKKGDGEA